MREAILPQMVGSSSSFQIWQNLEKLFVSQSKAYIMRYKMQLQTTKKGESLMIEYLPKIRSITDALAFA